MFIVKRLVRGIDPGLIVVAVICLIAIWPFISRPGLPQETDAELHVFRLHELSYLVRGGELYPRWAPNFYHGYGYPIFNYYAPLTYYLGLLIEMWPWYDAVAGVKAGFVLGLLLAGLAMYAFVRDNWGRQAGFVAASLYVYSPYVQYIDPHARGVLPESFSFGLFPLALWLLDRLRRSPTAGSWVGSVIVVAAVILTHNLMGLLFFALLTSWTLWMSFWPDTRDSEATPEARSSERRRRTLLSFTAIISGLGFATFFWLPVILERNAVNLNTLIGDGGNYDFHNHFVSVKELLSSTLRLDWAATEPAFRFSLGVSQWLLGSIGVVMILLGLVIRRRQLVFFVVTLAILLFCMTPYSTIVWETVPFLPYFQFPWRLLGASAAMLAILAAAGFEAVSRLLRQSGGGWSAKASGRLCAVLVIVPVILGLPLSEPTPWPEFGEVSTLRMSLIEQEGRWLGTTSTADYVPSTVVITPKRNKAVVQAFYTGDPLDRVNRSGKMIPEGASVRMEPLRPLHTRYHVSTPVDFPLRLFQLDFPGWTVRIDGAIVETELGLPEGFIVVPVPAGEHVVDVSFESTPARRIAGAISMLSALLAGVVALNLSSKTRNKLATDKQSEIGSSTLLAKGEREILVILVVVILSALLVLKPMGWLHLYSEPFTAGPADVQLFADFGEQIALVGYDVTDEPVEAGGSVHVTLYWQAQVELAINYQVFLHLLGPDGALVAQSDKLNPGDFPTKRWPTARYVRDEHRLELPADLAAGQYVLSTGLWVQEEGWRLPLLDESGDQIGDSFPLQELSVTKPVD